MIFELVSSPEDLLPLINFRLPKSAHIHNMIKLYRSFTLEMSFYRLVVSDRDDTEGAWILGKYVREDNGQQFVISGPNDLSRIPDTIESAFAAISPEIIDWNKQFEFVALSPMILAELVTRISIKNGNNTEILPCQFFYFPPEKVENLHIRPIPARIRLESLNSPAGKRFLCSRYVTNERSKLYRIKCAERCPSIGAYLSDNKVVSGASLAPTGHTALLTFEEFQRRGIGAACLEKLIESLFKETSLLPCSLVYFKNVPSMQLHLKLGYDKTHHCSSVYYKCNP